MRVCYGQVPPADGADARSEAASEIKPEVTPTPAASTSTPTAIGEGTADAPMEIVDVEDGDTKPVMTGSGAGQVPTPAEALQQPSQAHTPTYPGGFSIDVCFEASKLPLDVAIFNSARAAGGDEKIRKYLQAVLVVGGTALVPGMAHALESR